MSNTDSQSEHGLTTCDGTPSGEATVGERSEGEKLERCDQSSHVEIQEGQARILFPSSNQVFYNPVQEFNRDLRYSILDDYNKWAHDSM